jgi:hypothetical protein
MFGSGILRILKKLLDEAALRPVAAQQITDVLDVSFGWMLNPAKPDST